MATNKIDEKGKFAISSVFRIKTTKSHLQRRFGRTLINDDFDPSKPYEVPNRIKANNLPFPYGDQEPKDTIFPKLNYEKLEKAVANAFDKKGEKIKRTRALLVIYKDQIIAEKYDGGFD